MMRQKWTLALIAAVVIGLAGLAGPARADCTTQQCQSSHEASSPGDVGNGCCIQGVGSGDAGDFNVSTCGDGSEFGYRTWTRVLINITHDANCRNTDEPEPGGQSCIPCGFGPYGSGQCSTPPVRSITLHEHYRTNAQQTGYVYTHKWWSNYNNLCNCGKHGCQ